MKVKHTASLSRHYEALADLTPNMRSALKCSINDVVAPKDTYWITLQGMASRGLVRRPNTYDGVYPLTVRGAVLKEALKGWGGL